MNKNDEKMMECNGRINQGFIVMNPLSTLSLAGKAAGQLDELAVHC